MLYAHSAAWIALETLEALQPTELGYLPLVFELAGSRVARTMAGAARMARKLVACIVSYRSDVWAKPRW